MKSRIQTFDLALCLLWILSTFCGHYYWNQPATVFLCAAVVLRLALSFVLSRKEKKSWIPLLAYAIISAFLSICDSAYKGIEEIGKYFFHVTGLKYNHYVDMTITGSVCMWIIILPFICYVYLLIRRKLVVNNGMTKKELFGSILWNDRRAQYFCAASMLSFLSLNAGYEMQQRFCQTMCFIASPIIYWLLCRYKSVKAEKVWLVLLGTAVFWYAQCLGGVFRVMALSISLLMIAYPCICLFKSTRSYMLSLASIIFLGVLLPSFSIGYNQYACINYPRSGYYYLAPYNGILYINNTTNGKLVGLRDRYGLLINPVYESIHPASHTPLGWVDTFLLQKDGYSLRYDIDNNEILPSDIKPELQV